VIVIAKKKIRKLLPIIVVLLLGYIIFSYIKNKNSAVKVTTYKVELRNISKTISASGEIGVTEGNTKRALIAGSVDKIYFKGGDLVKKDDVILTLDRASLTATLNTSYSTYLSAKADADSYNQQIFAAKASESSTKLDRDEAWRTYMSDNDEDNKQAFKTAEAAYQTAVSSLKTLEDARKSIDETVNSTYSSYVSALNNYSDSTIKTPSNGQLALNDIYEGSYVTAGQKLFSVVNLNDIIFKAEIDEADVAHVSAGMPATITLDSYPGKSYKGNVSRVDSKVITKTDGSTIVTCDITFENKDLAAIIGLNGSADIEFEKTDKLIAVSVDTVFQEAEKSYVF
jgi:multidrug efflux pump subunit AcrA (membrane-fusion protein)